MHEETVYLEISNKGPILSVFSLSSSIFAQIKFLATENISPHVKAQC